MATKRMLAGPSARTIASKMPSGAITALSESGQSVSTFGSHPLQVINGLITRPTADGVTNIAGYGQIKLPSKVYRAGAKLVAPVGSNSAFALVFPAAEWKAGGTGPLGPAGVHYVVYPTGAWHVSFWTGATESTPFYAEGVLQSWADGVERRAQITVNSSASSATIEHPDGSVSIVTDSRIAANISEYVVWEIYRTSGTGEVVIGMTDWWADHVDPVDRSGATLGDVKKAIDATTPPANAAMLYRAATEVNWDATLNTTTDVDATNMQLTFTAPKSGQVMVDVEAFLKVTNASTHYLWGLRATGGTPSGTGLQRVSIGLIGARTRCRWLLAGMSPGAVITVYLQHLAGTAAGGGIINGQSSGYYATMTATPAN